MIAFSATKRSADKRDARQVRKQGLIPAVVYGQGMESLPVSVDYKLFNKIYNEAGENTIIELAVADKKYNVLVKDVQLEPVKDTFVHVDFYQINMKEKITVSIPLVFIGEVALVKSGEAIMIKAMDEVEVECLPGDMPHEITVDLSKLQKLEDSISIKDLQVSDKVEILAEPEESIVSLDVPREEEKIVAAVEAVPVVGEKKVEGEAAPAVGDKKEAVPAKGKEKKEA